MDSSPIACTLSVAELADRMDEVEELGRDALLGADRGERSVSLRFRPDAHTLARVESFVAAESSCCAFLSFDLAREEEATVLTITAPPGGEQVLTELAGRFAAGSAAR